MQAAKRARIAYVLAYSIGYWQGWYNKQRKFGIRTRAYPMRNVEYVGGRGRLAKPKCQIQKITSDAIGKLESG